MRIAMLTAIAATALLGACATHQETATGYYADTAAAEPAPPPPPAPAYTSPQRPLSEPPPAYYPPPADYRAGERG